MSPRASPVPFQRLKKLGLPVRVRVRVRVRIRVRIRVSSVV